MWKSLSEVFDSVSQKVQQKVNGEETTAEYYNPIGQDESQFSRYGNNENYAEPGFESYHVTNARLGRIADDTVGKIDKLTGTNIATNIVGEITGADYISRSTSFPQTYPKQHNNNNFYGNNMSDSPNRSVKKDLATDLSRKMQEMQNNNQQNNDNSSNGNNNFSNNNNNNFNRPANRNPGEQTFVFHSDVNDTEERVSYDFTLDPRHSLDEIKYQIIQVQKDPAIQSSSSISNSIDFDSFSSENNSNNPNSNSSNQNSTKNNQTLIIAHRNQFPKLISLEIFLKNSRSYINFGDLLEFAADNKKSHWVVYLGPLGPDKIDHCLHYSKFERKISIKPLASVAKDRPIRRVNGVYHYETKSTENIKMAVTKIKQAIENSNNNNDKTVINKIYNSFNSSEAFAAWVRYQVDDFLVNKENASISYKLQVTLGDGQIDAFEFSSLSKAIDKVRLLQKEGLRSVTESKNKMKDLLLF